MERIILWFGSSKSRHQGFKPSEITDFLNCCDQGGSTTVIEPERRSCWPQAIWIFNKDIDIYRLYRQCSDKCQMLTNISIITPLLYLYNLYFLFCFMYWFFNIWYDFVIQVKHSTGGKAFQFTMYVDSIIKQSCWWFQINKGQLSFKAHFSMMSIDNVSLDVLIENQTFYPVYPVTELCFYMYCNDVENDP